MVELRTHSVQENMSWIWHRMSRTKVLPSNVMETPLKRCLNTFDVTLLGIGHMVGAGIYVLVGTVAKDTAGPAIILSFLIAGIASLLSALCYAEFGARVPKAGSAYVYTYVTIGEFWAFVIGWNILLEHLIGAASVAKAWSGYVDSLFNGAISNSTKSTLGEFHDDYLAPFPDPLAFSVTFIYCALLTIGVKGSTHINSVFTIINMLVVSFVIGIGFYYADLGNWQLSEGFAPFGFSGVIAGAATCFYAFVGFDSIATSSEEVKNPETSIPVATILSMIVVTFGYILVGAALTLMVPYYKLNPAAAFPDAFAQNGLVWAKYIVSIGALCGMTTSLFGALFSLPRCIYAMASDGLLFSWLAKVSEKTQVPVLNMMLSGFLAALIALLFDIEKLVEFMSIGTLMAYTIVSACVIILRYKHQSSIYETADDETQTSAPGSPSTSKDNTFGETVHGAKYRLNFPWLSTLNPAIANRVVSFSVIAFTVISLAICSFITWGFETFQGHYAVEAMLGLFILCVLLAVCVIIIAFHQQNDIELSFKVPLVPFLPLFSIFINVGLMTHLNPLTWVRFTVWMAIGLLLYFCYGIHHSTECEAINSFSTLLPTSEKEEKTVFSGFKQKLSEVSSSMALNLKKIMKKNKSHKFTEDAADHEPIVDRSPCAD